MDSAAPLELHRMGFLEKFSEPTETVYRRSALLRSWPSARFVLWISVVVWATNPLLQPRLMGVDDGFPPKVYVVAWGVGLPLVLVTALLP